MAGKAILKETIKKNTIERMKKLGTYKAEFDTVIDVYAGLCEQYERLNKQFIDSGFKFQEATADGGYKKAPIVATLETLRKDILAYSDRLCLNPKAIDSVVIEKKSKSKLAQALSSLNG